MDDVSPEIEQALVRIRRSADGYMARVSQVFAFQALKKLCLLKQFFL